MCRTAGTYVSRWEPAATCRKSSASPSLARPYAQVASGVPEHCVPQGAGVDSQVGRDRDQFSMQTGLSPRLTGSSRPAARAAATQRPAVERDVRKCFSTARVGLCPVRAALE
jgi:hypothetical protein